MTNLFSDIIMLSICVSAMTRYSPAINVHWSLAMLLYVHPAHLHNPHSVRVFTEHAFQKCLWNNLSGLFVLLRFIVNIHRAVKSDISVKRQVAVAAQKKSILMSHQISDSFQCQKRFYWNGELLISAELTSRKYPILYSKPQIIPLVMIPKFFYFFLFVLRIFQFFSFYFFSYVE